jgi:hypothetical protein
VVFPVRDAFRRSVALGEPSSITASTACARVSTTDAPSPVAFCSGLVRPARFQPQPKARTPDRRRQPTSATVKEHGHTDDTARSPHRTRCFGAFCRSGLRNCGGTASGADAPFARGQGRHRPAGVRVSLRDGSRRGPLATNLPNTSSSLAARLPRIWSSLEPRTASQGLSRSAARTVRTFDRPRCFPSPGILAGADPATTVREGRATARAARRLESRLVRHPSLTRLDRRADKEQRR